MPNILETIANQLLSLSNIKNALATSINRLVPNGIDEQTPFADYSITLDGYTPSGGPTGLHDVISVGERVVDEIVLGEKYYTPEVSHTQLNYIDNFGRTGAGAIINDNGWIYDADNKTITNPQIPDSGFTCCCLIMNDWTKIDNNDVYLRLIVDESSEGRYDYGTVIVTTDGTFTPTLNEARGGGTLPQDSVRQMFNGGTSTGTQLNIDCTGACSNYDNVYIWLCYSKDGSGSSGTDTVSIRFQEGYFIPTKIIDSPEIIYYDYFVDNQNNNNNDSLDIDTEIEDTSEERLN